MEVAATEEEEQGLHMSLCVVFASSRVQFLNLNRPTKNQSFLVNLF
jgi:hypothetical protein